jgi:flagellar FliJ protein
MRRFRFKLEKVLELRKNTEREWELKLARISGICINLKSKIEALKEEKSRISAMTVETGEQNSLLLDMSGRKARENYVSRLTMEIGKLNRELEEREQERSEVKEGYLKASRERKVLDKLKEKKADDYYKEQLGEEQSITDDVASRMSVRNGEQGNEES